MTEDRPARRAAPDERGSDDLAPASGATPTRGYTDHDGAELPFPANVRRRMAIDGGPKQALRKSMGLTVVSALIPGLGLLGATRPALRALGLLTGLAAIVGVASLAYYAATNTTRLAKLAVSTQFLAVASIALIALGLVWVTLITLTQLATRPSGLGRGKRALAAILVTVLAFGVTAPTAIGARYARDQALLLDNVFTTGEDEVTSASRPTLPAGGHKDPWAHLPRVNILLLGADGSDSRAEQVEEFSIRTDTIMLASIDTQSGATTLIQIPRNVQHTPFPEGSEMDEAFPNGFRGDPAGDWYINSIWAHTERGFPDLFAGSTYRGAEALKQGVEGVTGLNVDYFAMLNIDGVQRLIDAMGGVRVNINQRLAIGGNSEGRRPSGYLEPGPNQHLMGYDAMWYARSRLDYSDYDRMARQSCLVSAIIRQANPATMLTRYEAIAEASSQMIVTDIPQRDLPAIVELALRVKDAPVTRLVYSPGKNGYSYEYPDFEAMRAAAEEAIAATTASPSPTVVPSVSAVPTPTGSAAPWASPSASSPSPSPTGELTDGAQNVVDACAWQGGEDDEG